MAPATPGGLTVGVGGRTGVGVGGDWGVAVGAEVGVGAIVCVGAKVWVGDTWLVGVGDGVEVDAGGWEEVVGTSVGVVVSIATLVPGGSAARVPCTPASMVAWISGAGPAVLTVGLSAAGELAGVPVPWTGTQAASDMPIISNPYVMPLDRDIRNKEGPTRRVLIRVLIRDLIM